MTFCAMKLIFFTQYAPEWQQKGSTEGEPPLADSQVTKYEPLLYGSVAHFFPLRRAA